MQNKHDLTGRSLLLLIDGDNINFTYYQPLVDYIAACGGQIDEVHLFGKLDSHFVVDWTMALQDSGIVCHTIDRKQKNATDIQLISIAMEKHFTENKVDFCIVSSDSDFSNLVGVLPMSCIVSVAYISSKASSDYISFLNQNNCTLFDLEKIRGDITDKQRESIANLVVTSYLSHKLSANYISYHTILSLIKTRYKDIGINSVEDLRKLVVDKVIHLGAEGIELRDLNNPTRIE